jgi:hypothetical protein
VRHGQYAGICPVEVAQVYADFFELKILPITDRWAHRKHVIGCLNSAALTSAARGLLDHLCALAVKGAPCPSNLALARQAGLIEGVRWGKANDRAKRRVRYLLQGLCDAQHIRITPGSGAQHSARPARHKARVVTILTGKHAGKSTGEG